MNNTYEILPEFTHVASLVRGYIITVPVLHRNLWQTRIYCAFAFPRSGEFATQLGVTPEQAIYLAQDRAGMPGRPVVYPEFCECGRHS